MQKNNLEIQRAFVDKNVELCYNIVIIFLEMDGNSVISYSNLWKICIDKKLKKTDLMKITGISSATLAKLSNDEFVSLKTLETICLKLNCNFSDIISIDKTMDNKDENCDIN